MELARQKTKGGEKKRGTEQEIFQAEGTATEHSTDENPRADICSIMDGLSEVRTGCC